MLQGAEVPRVNLQQLLKVMIDKGASDMHITTGAPPLLRVDGSVLPLSLPALGPIETKHLCYSILTEEQKITFEKTNELDFSFGVKNLSRFRANLFVQRGAVAGAFRSIPFKVRTFDDAREDAAVSAYCKKRAPKQADDFIKVFRDQRTVLAPQQGQERTTWVQAMLIGDIAIVGVPAEFFTVLGQDIKRRSPFRYTYVAELANDWIGYLPDRKAFDLGGYQTWTGLHSFAEPGTGEKVVDAAVELLEELAKGK